MTTVKPGYNPTTQEKDPANIDLTPLAEWNVANLPIWPQNLDYSSVLLSNNSSFTLDLTGLKFKFINAFKETVASPFAITKVIVSWDDVDYEYEYTLPSGADKSTWGRTTTNWLNNIGPITVEVSDLATSVLESNSDEIPKSIFIQMIDTAGHIYGLEIKTTVEAQSFYRLNIELDVKKAVYNGEIASVILKPIIVGNESSLPTDNIPIVSILT